MNLLAKHGAADSDSGRYEELASPCPLCGGTGQKLIDTRNGFSINRCDACSGVYVSPIPDEATLKEFYVGYEYAMPAPKALEDQARHIKAGAAEIYNNVAALRGGQEPRRILDYGGGLGFFAAAFAEKSADVSLFDLDPSSREFAAKTFPGKFRIWDDPQLVLKQQPKYDFILLNQVIEHAPDPIALLASLTGALESNGIIAVTTPNNGTDDMWFRPDILRHYLGIAKGSMTDRIKKLWLNSWLCCDPPRHLFAFNEKSLAVVASRSGLSPVLMDSKYFDQDPFGQPKYRLSGFGSSRAMAHTFLYAYTKLTAPVARVIDTRKRRGTTLIAYLKKAE